MFRVWDLEQKSLFLRVQPSGRKVFAISYRIAGVSKEFTVGMYGNITLNEARTICKQKIGEVASEKDIQEIRKTNKKIKQNQRLQTLEGFLTNHYEAWAKNNLKSHNEQIRVINRDFADFLKKPMLTISPIDLQRYKNKSLDKGLKPSTISRRIAVLKSVLSKAVELSVIPDSPLRGYGANKGNKIDHQKPPRYLSKDEEKMLRATLNDRQQSHRQERVNHIEWCEIRNIEAPKPLIYTFTDYLQPLVILALNTGMRRGELLSLEWPQVDVRRRLLTVLGEKSKSNQTRHIPLNDEAFQILMSWRNQADSQNYVFTSPITGNQITNINTAWRNILKAANIKSFRFHDLRHTFASNLVMRGISLNTVRELLGHHSIDMTLRYAHLAPEHKAEAVAVLND